MLFLFRVLLLRSFRALMCMSFVQVKISSYTYSFDYSVQCGTPCFLLSASEVFWNFRCNEGDCHRVGGICECSCIHGLVGWQVGAVDQGGDGGGSLQGDRFFVVVEVGDCFPSVVGMRCGRSSMHVAVKHGGRQLCCRISCCFPLLLGS